MSVTHTVQAFRLKYDTTLHTLLLALFTPRIPLLSMDERYRASCNCTGQVTADHRPSQQWLRNRVSPRGQDYFTVFHPEGRIILPCSTFMFNEIDVMCHNCDFVYGPTVLHLQQKFDLAKSGSGWLLRFEYPNLVSGRKSMSVHPKSYFCAWMSKQSYSV